jgi:hypothetical protein
VTSTAGVDLAPLSFWCSDHPCHGNFVKRWQVLVTCCTGHQGRLWVICQVLLCSLAGDACGGTRYCVLLYGTRDALGVRFLSRSVSFIPGRTIWLSPVLSSGILSLDVPVDGWSLFKMGTPFAVRKRGSTRSHSAGRGVSVGHDTTQASAAHTYIRYG